MAVPRSSRGRGQPSACGCRTTARGLTATSPPGQRNPDSWPIPDSRRAHGLENARRFLREHHRGVLATRRDGRATQQSPVLVKVDAEGRAIVSSRETALKTRNLRRDSAFGGRSCSDGRPRLLERAESAAHGHRLWHGRASRWAAIRSVLATYACPTPQLRRHVCCRAISSGRRLNSGKVVVSGPRLSGLTVRCPTHRSPELDDEALDACRVVGRRATGDRRSYADTRALADG